MDVLYTMTTEVLIRTAILRAHYKIDRESAELIAALCRLIRLKLRSGSPNLVEIIGLASDINDAIREAEKGTGGGIYS